MVIDTDVGKRVPAEGNNIPTLRVSKVTEITKAQSLNEPHFSLSQGCLTSLIDLRRMRFPLAEGI